MKLVTFLTIALAASATCPAATLVQTQSFQLSIQDSTNLNLFPTIVSQLLNFGQFDPALGILLGVQYTLVNSTASQSLTVSGARDSGAVNSSSVGTVSGTASVLGAPLLVVFLDSITATCSGNPNCVNTVSQSSIPTGALSLGPLAGYIGTGTVSTTLALSAGRTVPVGTPLFAAGLTRSADIDAAWAGGVTLTYLYETPEPGTWVFGALSGVLLAARSLRKRSADNA